MPHQNKRAWRARLQKLIRTLPSRTRLRASSGETSWPRKPVLEVNDYFKNRSSGEVRLQSLFSPSSQPWRRVAITPRSMWLQRGPPFHSDRRVGRVCGSAGSARSTSTNGGGSAKGGGSANSSDATNTTGKTATTQPSQLTVGGTASFSDGGAPIYDLTVTQFEDPAHPAEPKRHNQEPCRHFRRRRSHLQEHRHCRSLTGHLQRHHAFRFSWPRIRRGLSVHSIRS